MRYLLLLGFLLLAPLPWAFAQEGPHRPSTQWKQIDTDTVKVIFAEGLEDRAQRVASIVHALASGSTSAAVGERAEKVTIILRNQTTIPNGFVAIAPFRSEFFTTSPQYNFAGTTNWMDLLSIHEYRHVLQNQNAKVGATKIGSVLFGQNGWGFMSGTALPRWYMEGDAVIAETAFTQGGRGRMPNFDMEYRALRLEGRKYNYEKASAGSYKDFVPNHYVLGYHMTGYARKNHGKNVWAKAVKEAGAFKSPFFPLSSSLKKSIGLRTPELYEKSMDYLDEAYPKALSDQSLESGKQITQVDVYTDYRQPLFISDEEILVLKSGFEEIPTFYKVNLEGEEERLFQPGFNIDINFQASVGNGLLVWSENTYHPRWTMEDYSIIRSKVIEGEGSKNKLTAQSRYFSPALSADGLRLAAIDRNATDQSASIVLLSISNGSVSKTLPNPEGYRFHHLRWLPDGQSLLSVLRKGQQNAVARIDAESGKITLLTPWSTEHFSQPFAGPEWVFFSATNTGINNIFAVKSAGGNIYQVTNDKLGAFDPSVSPNGKKLVYTSFSSLGHQLSILDINPNKWKKASSMAIAYEGSHLPMYTTEADVADSAFINNFPQREFETERYRNFGKLFNLHSWNPVLSNPDQRELGMDFIAEDKMSTFSTTVSYRYNLNEERGRISAEMVYGGFFPQLRVGIVGQDNRSITRYSLQPTDTLDDGNIRYDFFFPTQEWSETSLYAGITIPLNLTFSNMFTNLDLSADWYWRQLDYTPIADTRFRSGIDETINTLDLTLDFSSFKQQARKHVFPRLGFGAFLKYRQTVGTTDNIGENFFGQVYLYLPSPFKTHGLRMQLITNNRNHLDPYQFTNFFGGSRGYGVPIHDKATKFSATYALPILYPDLALGPFAFIQRIKARPFFDYTNYTLNPIPFEGLNLTTNEFNFKQMSAGVEVLFDFRAIRLLDAEMGFRYSYLNNYQDFGESTPHSFEFIFFSLNP